MLNFGNGHRIFLAQGATDMRKSYDTLAALVADALGSDPYSGDVFVFVGKRRDRVKILVWEVSGFWLCSKRLERGTFAVGSRLGPVGYAWPGGPVGGGAACAAGRHRCAPCDLSSALPARRSMMVMYLQGVDRQ